MEGHIATYTLCGETLTCASNHTEAMQGYIFGGVVAGPLGWRAAFLLEAAAMVPFVLFCALAPPINLKGMEAGAPLLSVVLPSPLLLVPGRSTGECRTAPQSICIWPCHQLQMIHTSGGSVGSPSEVLDSQDGRMRR